MASGDPDAHGQKRPRLDSVNPAYNGLPPPPPPPPHAQPSRHPSHPTAAQPSPPSGRHYPPPQHNNLPPPPSPAYPGPGPVPGHYPGPHPLASPSLTASDIRAYSDPRNIPSPGQRTHGLPNPPVTVPTRTIPQDSIASYRQSATPQSAPDHQNSRSTSVDVKPPIPMDHNGPPGWPSHQEHRHNGSIPNGTGYPPPHQNGSPSHEQAFTPPLPPQHYGQPPNVYTPAPYMAQYSSQAQLAQQRRKQVRATQACNHCRSRKQKCDEARPCQFCRENQFDCQYKDVPPPKQDRSMMQLQDSVNNMSDKLASFLERFDSWKHSVDTKLSQRPNESIHMVSNHASPDQSYAIRGSFSEQNGSRIATPNQAHPMHRVNSMKNESPTVPHSHMSPVAAYASTPVKQEYILAAPQQPATPADSVRTDHTNSVGKSETEKQGLQGDHTTAAHQLLKEWPRLWAICSGMEAIKNMTAQGQQISDYPMLLEQKRGLVRVWGVGEGIDLNDGTQGPASPECNDLDPPSPRPSQEGLWGTGDHSSPSTMGSETPREYYDHAGGLGPDGKLNLSSKVIFDLFEAYQQNIHTLHPFLNPSSVRKMITEFSDKYSPDRDRRTANILSPGSAIPNHINPGIKRKRSSSSFTDPYSPARDRSTVSIERSLRNAIILLVLALGKVCKEKKPLRAPVNDKGPVSFGSWGPSPPPANNSFNHSFNDDPENRQRNIDIMPGMAYFSYATDILGNQQGGNTVAHAQAMLLAALYLGQFARVLESWSWINNACRICTILVKTDMHKIERKNLFDNTKPQPHYSTRENYRLNLVKCVYWTCLQLETDIIAELSSLPPSEISKYQARVSYPSGVFEKFPEDFSYDESSTHDRTMWIYSSQIHLRVILNEAHNTLYGPTDRKGPPGFDTKDLSEVAKAARVHADILLSWRRLLPPSLAWDDSEPPASDINIARLRAKFYGGHYMILRPFLYIAVHDVQLPQGPRVDWSSSASSPVGNGNPSRTPTDRLWHNTVPNVTSEQAGVLHVAHQCIDSAIQSTIAFDRVGDEPGAPYDHYTQISKERLIVTNIFGTLHAQFGNMLVLAAVFTSHLFNYLPPSSKLTKANLTKLYIRTIQILEDVLPNSPILMMDRDILRHIQNQLGLNP